MKQECDVCSVIQDDTGVLLESDKWTVRLARDQGYVGRSYVTLKDHKGSLSELSGEEWDVFQEIVRRLEKAAADAFQSSVQNWACMMNDAFKTDPATPHVHWHFRPRLRKSFSIGGVEFTDKDFGSHYDRDQRNYVSNELYDTILAHFKKHIDQ